MNVVPVDPSPVVDACRERRRDRRGEVAWEGENAECSTIGVILHVPVARRSCGRRLGQFTWAVVGNKHEHGTGQTRDGPFDLRGRLRLTARIEVNAVVENEVQVASVGVAVEEDAAALQDFVTRV